jgi:hypothetical protein
LRSFADFGEPLQADACVRVRTARVLVADYAKLEEDFPQLRDAALLRTHAHLRRLRGSARQTAMREVIDAWLLRHAALVSVTQAGQTLVNGPVDAFPETVKVMRPPAYFRAVVVALGDSNASLPPDRRAFDEPDALLDLKGAGVEAGATVERRFLPGRPHPGQYDFRTLGLHLLGAALGEYMIGKLVESIFRHARAPIEVVPHYAVIDLGFDDYKGRPVGILVRRSHRRNRAGALQYNPIGTPAYLAPVLIELVLRRYGFGTAHGPLGNEIDLRGRRPRWMVRHHVLTRGYTPAQIRRFRDLVAPGFDHRVFGIPNIQTTAPIRDGGTITQVVDLEAFAANEFTDPLSMLVGNRPFNWGGALWPHDPRYVRPHPRYKISRRDWGWAFPSSEDAVRFNVASTSACTRPALVGLRLARAVREGSLTRDQVAARLEAYVARTTRRWPGRSDAMRLAHRAAEALFASGATTGTEILAIDRDRDYARLMEAAESIVCLNDLHDPRLHRGPESPFLRHRLNWAVRRLLISPTLHELEAEMRGTGRHQAAVAALARLREPSRLSRGEIRRDLKHLLAAAPVAIHIRQLGELLRTSSGDKEEDVEESAASSSLSGSRPAPVSVSEEAA